jgi:tetratricopeptide (TPR) repeat protein
MTGSQKIAPLLLALTFLTGCRNSGERSASPNVASKPAERWTDATRVGSSPEEMDLIVSAFNRGVGLMERYRPVEAVAAFEEVVRLAPDWPTGRLNLGIALLNTQSQESQARAEVELKRVIEKTPQLPNAHFALGVLLKHLDRPIEARALFSKVLEIDPGDPDAHYQLGTLIMDDDPSGARTHFEKTLEKVPHHESAVYRLQTLLRNAGEEDRVGELLARFTALKTSRAGVTSGMKYGEMGRYADLVRVFDRPVPRENISMLSYVDVAQQAGLLQRSLGKAGWPAESHTEGALDFGPGAAVNDVDGDGDLDILLTSTSPEGRPTLYLNSEGHFSLATDSGLESTGTVGAFFGDYDKDGDPDLYLTRAGPNTLYQNTGDGSFIDVTQQAGLGQDLTLSVGAAWADADHDGDLDLYVANFSSWPPSSETGAPNHLWRNNGDGSFANLATEAGIDGGATATTSVVFFDADDDRDFDIYTINHGSANRLYLNQRVGQYVDATSRYASIADSGKGLGALLADLDRNGREDVLLLRGPHPPRLYLQVERGGFLEDEAFGHLGRGIGGVSGAITGDLDLDGDPDLVLLSAGQNESYVHRILMNNGTGSFAAPVSMGEKSDTPNARGAVAADFDGDGGLEILITKAGATPELWRAPPPGGRHWLSVFPRKSEDKDELWLEPSALGLTIEIKTGRQLQTTTLTSSSGYLSSPPPRAHFGLGEHEKADYVRLVWSDAMLQNELEVAADQTWQITKVHRKPSSCPILFAWDGERYRFVTDFLGVGGLGFFITPGVYAPPDPTEHIRIPPEKIALKNGRYSLRVAEPLEEVTYFDQLHLIAYDHPSEFEIYPDERFTGSPPLPTGLPLSVTKKAIPITAVNDRGQDQLDRLLRIDRSYVEPPLDERFVGFAEDHWLELDFGDRLGALKAEGKLILYLYGWVEYTYSHVNYAAHQAGISMRPPSIEVPDNFGGWRVAIPEAGFPAGLPRMMTVDISSLAEEGLSRLRIRSNMEIYWDQIFIARDNPNAVSHQSILSPRVAALRPLGYPREYSPDGGNPTLYDYHRLDQGIPFKNLTGDFTQFGDVRELLSEVDDRFVIMARGEEIALEFDATGLPQLLPGWSRTLVLFADGYCKDMDLYTSFPDGVDPLPYHAMKNYPPESPDRESADPVRLNTRRVVGR